MKLVRPRQHMAFVRKAVEKAAAFQLRHYGKLASGAVKEKAMNDFVTFVDRQSQDILIRSLGRAYPDYGFVAEEDGVVSDKEFQWVIDPLDGTVNYIHRISAFTISVALKIGAKVVLGVVYDPVHQEWFRAVHGHGAYLNRKRITVSKKRRLNQALLATGFPFRSKKRFEPYQNSFRKLFYASSGIRRMGSAAMDLCYTACGRFDGFWEIGLKEWDTAAASLIVQEAGGRVTDIRGTPDFLSNGDTVAGSKPIHAQLIRALKSVPGLAS